MRITLELSDDLLQQVETRAVMQGLTITDLLTRFVVQGVQQANEQRRRSAPPMIAKAAVGTPIQAVSAEKMRTLEVLEDVSRYDKVTGTGLESCQ